MVTRFEEVSWGGWKKKKHNVLARRIHKNMARAEDIRGGVAGR